MAHVMKQSLLFRSLMLLGLLVALAAWTTSVAARPPDVHHILILDDSGSMETQNDPNGFGLAVPQLFHRILGARATDRLTVFTLPAHALEMVN